MSDQTTRHMLPVYTQMAAVTRFLSGLFQSPRGNFYDTEEIEVDIDRSDEDISIVVTDIATGYRMNAADIYTNKAMIAPIHKEAVPLNSFDLMKRMPGDDPFADINFRANLVKRMMNSMVKVENKIRRSMELQAAQVLQTGTITLSDENGVALYTISFSPKATHFPTAGTTWGQAGWSAFDDIDALARVNRADGLASSDQLIFGADAFRMFLTDAQYLAQLDNRSMTRGALGIPQVRGEGGTFQGWVAISEYVYQMWTYDGQYKHQQTGVKTPYIDPEKVIVRNSQSRMDATFGAIPNIGLLLGAQSNNLLPEISGRFRNTDGGMDLHTNVWLEPNGENIFGGIGARPLMIPTAIDQFGCLDTGL